MKTKFFRIDYDDSCVNLDERYITRSLGEYQLSKVQVHELPPNIFEEKSICNKCLEICKATHPRKSCVLFEEKKIEPTRNHYPVSIEGLMEFTRDLAFKQNEIINHIKMFCPNKFINWKKEK